MNNAGEFFFSSPIDPFDLSKDWGRSDDDQRHRLVVNGAVKLPYEIEVSGAVQAYSSLPFNVTSGLTTIQGTAARPIVNGAFLERNAGAGSDFVNVNVRVAKAFVRAGGAELEGALEAFNLTSRRNPVGRNTNFGPGAYPSHPVAGFGDVTAVGDPATVQLAMRLRF